MVVHGSGVDELTPAGPCHVAHVADGRVVAIEELDPGALGLPRCTVADLAGGDPRENARIVRDLLAGRTGPRRDATLFTAAAVLHVAGHVAELGEGLERAAAAIDSGAAAALLDRLAARSAELSEETT
jgi:anthranilate phosphoribosyltransferase